MEPELQGCNGFIHDTENTSVPQTPASLQLVLLLLVLLFKVSF